MFILQYFPSCYWLESDNDKYKQISLHSIFCLSCKNITPPQSLTQTTDQIHYMQMSFNLFTFNSSTNFHNQNQS